MKTYGILDFELVDRKYERNKINSFINSDEHYMWINGETETGKTFLATQFEWEKFEYNFFHTEINGKKEYHFFEDLIEKINTKTGSGFNKFVLSNYKSIITASKNIVVSSLSNTIFKDKEFFKDVFSEFTEFFKNNSDTKQYISDILIDYLKKKFASKKVVLIIDDVSEFNNDNFIMLQKLLSGIHNNKLKNVKAILITNFENLNSEIKDFLFNNLSCDYIYVEPFKDELFFAEILLPKFPDDKTIIKLIPRIFEICNGYPEKLKKLLQNYLLYSNNVNGVNNTHLKIDYESFERILNNTSKSEFVNLSLSNLLVLKILINMPRPIEIDLLFDITSYVGTNLLKESIKYIDIYSAINELINIQLLRQISDTVFIFNETSRNMIKLYIENGVNDTNMINYYIYKFLNMRINENHIDINTSNSTIVELFVNYAYLTSADNWVFINFQYGLNKMIVGENSIASNIFDRLADNYNDLTENDFLKIIECFYNNGEYIKALSLLKTIDATNIQNSTYEYYYLMGKCNFIILNPVEASKYFLLAESSALTNDEKISAINMKIQSYKENSNGTDDADNAYADFLNHYDHLINEENLTNVPQSLSSILRNSIFFCTVDKAKTLCQKAIDISIAYNDEIGKAFAMNSLAYCYIKCNDIQAAKKLYIDAERILHNFKLHESAYCLNNIAVCCMLKDKYEEALSFLTEAALVSSSFYANYCIETHTMMCNIKLHRIKTAMEIANNLYYKINNNKIFDFTIIRRTNMNLCIVFSILKDYDKAKECLDKVIPTAANTLSEYRSIYYNNLLRKETHELPCNEIIHDTTIDFEPWLVMFSHD